jgi:hypothetical protein
MIEVTEVFDAVRRGYNQLEFASADEIADYFTDVEAESVLGHVSNIKGILFEQEYMDTLSAQGISANLYESTNHPLTDISILNPDGSVNEIQLKATDSASYINTTISENPEVELVTTSEVFESIDCENVIDSGISNADLNDAVVDNLFEDVVNPVSPLSGIGWLLGLPF